MDLKNQPPDSSLLRDISNLKTPKNPKRFLNDYNSFNSPFTQSVYHTASKKTPMSSARRGAGLFQSASRSKAARRLKAFELEQCKSARKAQIEKEKSMKTLAKSLTIWLNFLFESPESCGCELSKFAGEGDWFCGSELKDNGKRESEPGRNVVGVIDGPWRGPKRQRGLGWKGNEEEETTARVFSDVKFSRLKASLKEICSFEDMQDRMRMYLSLGSCKEIFETMSLITKNIDDGRLKMRSNCPIVSDVGIKEKAISILMCYNPIWLRIGLYIILGGDSLLPSGDVNSEQEIAFLRIVIEKQFFSHGGLAKTYSYNKLVEGLYRPGYYDQLGSVILKRFFLLVLILDRAKSHSSLPLKYGIDGLDGGSPLLFSARTSIKSSRQLINDFLSSNVMHGEGNLLAHLVIIGYKVTYQQIPLAEYKFKVTDLFEDLQDGVRLCRAIQLLQHDSSILMKIVVPSDTRKKNLVNCGIALQYMKQASVPLLDDDGMEIVGDDVANADKELLLSLLWNMFVHLQLPLLVNRKLLADEIFKIQGVAEARVLKHSHPLGHASEVDSGIIRILTGDQIMNSALLCCKFVYVQPNSKKLPAICKSYDLKVEEFSSLGDGKAMWCLLDYYFRKEHNCSTSFKALDDLNGQVSIVSASDYEDAVHNFILSQKLTSLLGNFPEVLQVSDLLEHNGASSDRSVVILLVFLSFQLLVKKNTDQLNFHKLLGFNCQSPERKRLSTERWFMHSDAIRNANESLQDDCEAAARKFKAIMSWWQDMAQQNKKGGPPLSRQSLFDSKTERENAARIIQAHFRRSVLRHQYLKVKNAVCIVQHVMRAWLEVKELFSRTSIAARGQYAENSCTYMMFLVDRHIFVKLRKSAVTIQRAIRSSISQRFKPEAGLLNDVSPSDPTSAAIIIQRTFHGWRERSLVVQKVAQCEKEANALRANEVDYINAKAALTIQRAYRQFVERKTLWSQHCAAIKIQGVYHGWRTRKTYLNLKLAVVRIQSVIRCIRCQSQFQLYRWESESAIIIQSYIRAWFARRALQANKMDYSYARSALTIQCTYRKFIERKILRSQQCAAVKIQRVYHGWLSRKNFQDLKFAAVMIQSVIRCIRCQSQLQLYRQESESAITIQSYIRGWIARREAKRKRNTVSVQKELSTRMEAITVIQSVFYCMKYRQKYLSYRHAAIQIQCFVKGELTRKRLLGASWHCETSRSRLLDAELSIILHCVLKLQKWWRSILLLKLKTKSAILIQSHLRGRFARKKTTREKLSIVMIQSHWRGYIARRNSKGQLSDLRQRLKKSAANVDDNRRLINRLVAAVSELLNMRSVSGILHTCATLDMATGLSQRCCEELVAAGAIGTLLKLIRSVSRSIPDQEILKHALSTLWNLARYPHLTEVLIETRESVQTIFLEMMRNKEEGYFIAAQLLRKMCKTRIGIEAMNKYPSLVKRLHNLVEELSRKAAHEKRNPRAGSRDHTDRRLREANELWGLIKNPQTTS